MTRDAPIVHLGLAALAASLLIVGGQAELGSWGSVALAPLAGWILAATLVHGVAVHLPRGGTVGRGLAWGVAAASTLHLTTLLRVEVLAPLLLAAAVDLALASRGTEAPGGPDPDPGGKAVAGTATLAALVLAAVIVPLAQSPSIALRLTATVAVGWACLTGLAVYPHLRSPAAYLGAAAATSLAFLLLAAPLLPFGPLLAYWVLVGSVGLAVVAAAYERVDPTIAPERVRHEQTVDPIPDPVLAPLADAVERFVATGRGAPELSDRVARATEQGEGDRLAARTRALADGEPTADDRARALAELLDVDPEDGDRA